jgi:hypothetical protein
MNELTTQLMEAAQRLMDKMGAIHNNPSYKAVWDLFYAHGHTYTGPDYVDELKALRDSLARLQEGDE